MYTWLFLRWFLVISHGSINNIRNSVDNLESMVAWGAGGSMVGIMHE
ncbi:MAG: hypothetical protein HXS41_15040 [Theionarchaea archaeon]|nr:hypothetical protein [Theionarchaea archaeon]MBU7022367.1 hypothetical protein [Theionarchaea archaeon]